MNIPLRDPFGSHRKHLEMNERGQHIQQESLLNWDEGLNMLKIPKDEHLSRSSRAAWVEQSLLRPMPKNPYAIQARCAPPSNAVLSNGRYLSAKWAMLTLSKGKFVILSVRLEFVPHRTRAMRAPTFMAASSRTRCRGHAITRQVLALHGLSFSYAELVQLCRALRQRCEAKD
mmetsp:Transcript_31165/g.61018  ORF Transcript_31165/g.61018 Transcript_31165/m.61018 type:complete len:173 (-) Transcript_31165:736-1254(-)